MAVGKINKPSDVSTENLTETVNSIYDKLNELIMAVNTSAKSTPKSSGSSGNQIKIIDDQSSGKVKLGIKSGNVWYTIEATEG